MIRLRRTSSKLNWTAATAFAASASGASTVPRISPLARNKTTRQRRFIRRASLAGVSFLRGIAVDIAPAPRRIESGRITGMADHPHTIDRPLGRLRSVRTWSSRLPASATTSRDGDRLHRAMIADKPSLFELGKEPLNLKLVVIERLPNEHVSPLDP